MAPPIPDAVRLEWVPYDGRPHDIQAMTCTVCRHDVTYLWATIGEQGLLRRTEWVNGTSLIVVGLTSAQAEAWWAELLAGRAI